ncbi:flagellar hook-basal body complex protein FliE [Amphibacillus jilinensis]|uniref:flagellar hook-basal body complex protein FliE n=1 Tax=Amphibacillus jilinensis TaxID=1216008 RepID=UPI0002E4CAAC|nr:flagellar hook-basal body complex protein FliE [Amphibacillus jilinensis]
MSVNLQFLQSIQPTTRMHTNEEVERSASPQQFSNRLKEAINQLNQSQVETEIKTEMLVNGEIDDLHDVMITAQKSTMSMSLAVEVQSKVIDAYNEMMRMQI